MSDAPKAQKKSGATRFHRLAKREGGITLDEAIRRADEFVSTVKPKYLDWVAEDVRSLATALAALSGHAPASPKDLDTAFHGARKIRDLGTTMGYPVITIVASSLCDLLERFKGGNVYSQPAIDTHMSSLLLVSSSAYDDLQQTVKDDLLPGLRRVVDRFPPTETPRES